MMRRLLLALIFSLLVSVSVLELLCRLYDPLGVVYFDDIAYLWSTRVEADHGYDHLPGQFAVGDRFAFTIGTDGNRYTPGRFAVGPRVTFIGDSQTFGYGVNDDAVWVTLVARALELNAVNAGRNGYNIENIAAYMGAIDGCVVWLTISNDPGAPVRYSDRQAQGAGSYLGQSLRIALAPATRPVPITEAAHALYAAIAARPDTLILALDDGLYGDRVRDAYGAVLIPAFTSRISRTDAHADAFGNQQIARSAEPIVKEWLQGRDCT